MGHPFNFKNDDHILLTIGSLTFNIL